MFVSDWMTKEVITVAPEDNISLAIKIMKEKKIKHMPVVKNGKKIVGILSDRDIKDYTPSKATTLDIHELHYVLFNTKVKDIMVKKVFTATPMMPIEEAAMIMYDKNIGCLPVVENDNLVGIISDKDIFRVLVDITGVRHKGNRFYVKIKDTLGATKEVIDIVRDYGFTIDSVLTTYEGVEKGYKKVVIRTKGKEGDLKGAISAFELKYGNFFFPY